MNPALIMVVLHIKHMRMMNCAIVPNVIVYSYITKYNGRATYQIYEDYTLCYRHKCKRLLVHEDDKQ